MSAISHQPSAIIHPKVLIRFKNVPLTYAHVHFDANNSLTINVFRQRKRVSTSSRVHGKICVKVAAYRSLILFLRTSLHIIAVLVSCRASTILQLIDHCVAFRVSPSWLADRPGKRADIAYSYHRIRLGAAVTRGHTSHCRC